MATGTVKWFNSSKGVGFISQDSTGPDVSVLTSEIQGDSKTLEEGQVVEFEVKKTTKGLEATNVRVK